MSEILPLVIYALDRDLPEAKTVFSSLKAEVLSLPREEFPESPVSIVYVGKAPEPAYTHLFHRLGTHHSGLVALYTNHEQTPPQAFEWGKLVQKAELKRSVWVHNFPHLWQILRSESQMGEHLAFTLPPFSLVEARRRLGLTQEQMAKALGVAPRTIQNWEQGVGLSLLGKKTEQLRRLLSLMDEFVIAPEEQTWLKQPLPALQEKTPRETIASGKLDELVRELVCLEEGMPV
jgi:DNA-binding XRE family transcriptional regulator